MCALILYAHTVGGDKSQILNKSQTNGQKHQTDADKYASDYVNEYRATGSEHLNSDSLNTEQTDDIPMSDGPRKIVRAPPYGTYGKYRKPPYQQPDDFHFTKEIVIKQGKLKGIVRSMPHQSGLKDVDQYLGVPFAEAPVGNMRFMPPGAPPPWAGLKVADNLSPVCPQNLPSFNATGHHLSKGRYDQLKRLLPYLKSESEDCLYLNLYVPRWNGIGPKQKYPVMIFIHGESYEWNSGNPYDGSVLASYGQVIVVTLNYRLGVLGFLKRSTNDHAVSNFGLLDQIAALHWVKENIDAFEGDNQIVTLFGHGTGAACVNLLMLSPVARDLFHRAIIMSGSALSDWATANTPLHSTTQILNRVNCPTTGDNEIILNCLWRKRYQELLKAKISLPNFATAFGPVVDNHIVPNEPQHLMSANTEVFSRYDLLFGLTEIESYHILNDIGLNFGIHETDRDNLLRIFMQNRYEMQPEIALSVALREYSELYGNPLRPLPDEHRDLVLDILSDARVAAPLLQTGLYHSRVNPRSYMYIFSHNSKASEYAHLSHSIVGEDLPYIFGAPLTSVGPFPTQYSVEERLLSEAMIVYWTNFAKTGNPKAPWRDTFLNLNPEDWLHYDIDWPEFNEINESYMNLGIPPALSHHYRSKYMNFWNKDLPYELSRAVSSRKPVPSYSDYYPSGKPILEPSIPRTGTSTDRRYDSGHVNKFRTPYGKPTEDPYKTLRLLMQESAANDTDMYKTQSTIATAAATPETPETIQELPPNEIVVQAGTTINIVIGVVITFLLISIIVLLVYLLRGADKKKQCKMDVLTLDGGTEDNLVKRSKYNDGDDSFIMDIVKKNDYDIPRDGDYKLCRQLSTSTMDAHTKVTDWIAQEIAKNSPKDSKKSNALSIYTKSKCFLKRPKKVSIAIDATPAARGGSVLRQEPIEITKSKSSGSDNKDIIICQEMDIDSSLIDSTPLRLSDIEGKSSSVSTTDESHALHIEHKHSRSDPVQAYYKMHSSCDDEQITSFIDNSDINVTSRDELTERDTMSPEEALKTIQRRNFPKVLPTRFPDDDLGASMKRRSLPPQYFENNFKYVLGGRVPPTPPPRTTSTLGRVPSNRRASKNMLTSPLQMAENPPVEEEPKISENRLHIGPLIPKSSENLYSTFKTISKSSLDSPTYAPVQMFETERVREEKPRTQEELDEATDQFVSEKRAPPKIIIRPGVAKCGKEGKYKSNIPRVQVPMDGGTTSQLDRCTSISGSSSSETSSSTGTVRKNF